MQRAALPLLVLMVLGSTGVVAEQTFDFFSSGPYREGVPTPTDYLGYEAGELHTHHFRMEAYFQALEQAAPERVTLHAYGESYEKKRLFYAVISSPENLALIDQIRQSNLSLADPRTTSAAEAELMARSQPIIVWLDYGNDGNETANIEAAMHVAYQLVAGESEEIARLRREAVIIVEPDHNPESHDRHVTWYNAFGLGDADRLAMEHDAPWGMSTNNNHYQIDLNRDAWPLAQQETQALAAEVLRWRPQVFVDHHGQTENYFFAPPVDPINASLPDSHTRWYEVFGQGNARAFDAYGWQYYVRDVFDLFYPGYWDSWPALHGAIGMTYETDAGGYLGNAWTKSDGHTATFRGGIAKHFTASLATVRTAVDNREAILNDFHRFFASGMAKGRAAEAQRAFVIDATDDPRKSAALVGTLLRHGIEVERASAEFSASARRLGGRAATNTRFPAGSYIVDMAQPDQRAAETYLSLQAPLDAAFAERQFAKWSRNARRGANSRKEFYEFYDITSWSLPVAFGVRSWSLSSVPKVATEAVTGAVDRLAEAGFWANEVPFDVPGIRGGVSENVATLGAGDGTTQARSTYLFTSETEGAMRLLAALLEEDYRVAVSIVPIVVGEREFPRGTFVVRVVRNRDSLHERIEALSSQAGVEVFAADTAFPMSGQYGVGSNVVLPIEKPRIVILADEGVRITEYGAAWFTLERRLGYPFTPMRLGALARADLGKIDVIIVPHGSASTYQETLGEKGLAKIGEWIQAGGTLVGWGVGAMSLVSDADWAEVTYNAPEGEVSEEDKAERLAEIDALSDTGEVSPPIVSPSAKPDAPLSIPGSVARTRLDLTHWMTIGFELPELPVLVRGSRFLKVSEKGDNPVVFVDGDDLEVSGFFWPGNSEKWLGGTAYAVVEPTGRGQVILFTHDPNFRLAWRATSRLFVNAVLLGPSLGVKGPGRF